MQNRNRLSLLFCILHSAFCVFLLALSGCTTIGVAAGKLLPPPTIPAAYKGLANQSVAVMVWAGGGTLIDFPDVRLDLNGSMQNKLVQAQQAKTKELLGTTFPFKPAAIVKMQENHPEFEAQNLTDVAPKISGVTRVVYIELADLQTRSNASVELFRGSASATMKVIEIENGKGKVAYEESNIPAVFPPKAREEGTPDGNDFAIYRGTVDALSSELAKRFVPHQEEQ